MAADFSPASECQLSCLALRFEKNEGSLVYRLLYRHRCRDSTTEVTIVMKGLPVLRKNDIMRKHKGGS